MNSYFLKMIRMLREQEETILYGNILAVSEAEAVEVSDFLQKEYWRESLDYPFTAPELDLKAALWGAKTVYIAAQLILYRENKDADLDALLPDFEGEVTPSTIMSADLCLRFLPDMLVQLKLIDTLDPLIEVLEEKLIRWHYSGVQYPLETERLDFEAIYGHACLKQMYANRIVEHKQVRLAKIPVFQQLIQANFGMYGETFWKDFKIETTLNEQLDDNTNEQTAQ